MPASHQHSAEIIILPTVRIEREDASYPFLVTLSHDARARLYARSLMWGVSLSEAAARIIDGEVGE